MRMNQKISLFFFLLSPFFTVVSGQEIVKIKSSYVLIDSEEIDGAAGDILPVYRWIDQAHVQVGSVKIIVIKDGLTAARIETEVPPYKLKERDWVGIMDELTSAEETFLGASDLESLLNANQFSKEIIGTPLKIRANGQSLDELLKAMDIK